MFIDGSLISGIPTCISVCVCQLAWWQDVVVVFDLSKNWLIRPAWWYNRCGPRDSYIVAHAYVWFTNVHLPVELMTRSWWCQSVFELMTRSPIIFNAVYLALSDWPTSLVNSTLILLLFFITIAGKSQTPIKCLVSWHQGIFDEN